MLLPVTDFEGSLHSSWRFSTFAPIPSWKADDTTPILVPTPFISANLQSSSWNLFLRSIPLLFSVVGGQDQILQWKKTLFPRTPWTSLDLRRSCPCSWDRRHHDPPEKRGPDSGISLMFHSILVSNDKMGFDKDSFRGYSGRQTGDFHRRPMVFWVLQSISMGNRAHSFDLSEFQFYSQDMTRKFVSSSKSLTCSGHFKIQMLIPPNGPKSS